MIRSSFISYVISFFVLTLVGVTASAASDTLLCQLDTFPGSFRYSHDLSMMPLNGTFSDGKDVIATIQVPDHETLTMTMTKGDLNVSTTFKAYYGGTFGGTINLNNTGAANNLLASLQCIEVREN